jgi:hypothetical protein
MVCPIINEGRSGCSKALTFQNLDRAVAYCGNAFHECPIYARHFGRGARSRGSRRCRAIRESA